MQKVKRLYRKIVARPTLNRIVTDSARSLSRILNLKVQPFINHLPRQGLVQAPLPNGRILRLYAEIAEAYSNLVYWKGWKGPEPETAPVFWEIAEHSRSILDVGAHVGYYSLLGALANPSALVHAFEPVPHVADRLVQHCALNNVTNVELHQVALDRTHGDAPFYYSSAIPVPSASGLSREALGDLPDTETITVERNTIDRFVKARRITHIDLIKIDTEGTELDVLSGAKETLSRFRPAMIVEVLPSSDTYVALTAMMNEFDYRFLSLTLAGPELLAKIRPVQHARNWLLLPVEHLSSWTTSRVDLPGHSRRA